MSSRASIPVDSDDELAKAMAQETPTTVRTGGEKRTHMAMTGDNHVGSEDEDGAGTSLPLALALPNQNAVAAVRHYGKKLRLHADQGVELETALTDPAHVRETKLMTNIFALRNDLTQIIASQPGFEVSSELKTNIAKYAPTTLLSEKLSSYKGNSPKTLLLEVIKRLRFGHPRRPQAQSVGLGQGHSPDRVCPDAEALKNQESINPRSVRVSTNADTKKVSYAPPSERQNIFELATAVVKGTSCSVNIILCSRIALMRKVYMKHPNDNFWDELDKQLQKIRTDADGDAKKLVRAFRYVLEKDQNEHGKKTYKDSDIEDNVDEFQKTLMNFRRRWRISLTSTSAQDQHDEA
ncbi:hypothetical protein B0H16DRAFT_1484696 [Mycena metata]|uniref:Uncharacterized protein n=1 Tax=Mycena metata TaxID=1033252 RepID=A0AAD7DR24_9AGAR|nr:hypothetical protein B0H16DRAFT_1484696 [Mycena metata]